MHSQQPTYKEIFTNIEEGINPPTSPASLSLPENPIFADINKQLQNMLSKINNFEKANQTEEETIAKKSTILNEDLKLLHKKLDNISIALLAEYKARKNTSDQILAKLNFLAESLIANKKNDSHTAANQQSTATTKQPRHPQNWQESLSQLFNDDSELPPFGLHPYQDPLSKDGAYRLIKRAENYQKALKKEQRQAI